MLGITTLAGSFDLASTSSFASAAPAIAVTDDIASSDAVSFHARMCFASRFWLGLARPKWIGAVLQSPNLRATALSGKEAAKNSYEECQVKFTPQWARKSTSSGVVGCEK